jgi:colicin import membrane protein
MVLSFGREIRGQTHFCGVAMSTVHKSQRPSPQNDPFFYGWRDSYIVNERGRRVLTRIPLTRDDVLHPQEGDHIAQNDVHNEICHYLQNALRTATAHRPEISVFGDLIVAWDVPGLERGNCPDVTVVIGARRRRRRNRFVVAAERVRPELLIEVTSQSTRSVDLRDKRRAYYQAGVPFYVIVDDEAEDEDDPVQLRLLGYQRGARGYRQQRLNSQGRLRLETVGLWLGIEGDRVVCYDQNGAPIRDLPEETQARVAAEQAQVAAEQARVAAEERAAAEVQARAEMETRLREMEAELKRLRGEE